MGANANSSKAGIRKAAILLASIDEYAADVLLDQLDPQRARLVRQAVMAIDEIDADEQRRVIEEFRRIGPMLPGQSPPGIELDGTLGWQLALPIAQEPADNETDGAEAARPFGFLQEAEEENLVQLLLGERPQTIALVLSHLAAERAALVLSRFAPAPQVEIVRLLADLENTDPETLCDIQRSLKTRLSQQFAADRGRAAGPEAVARIFAACDGRVAANILDNLTTYDRPLAERLGCRPLEFDELVGLDDAALLATFRTAEPEVAQAALLGAKPELLRRLLRLMAPEEAEELRQSLDHPDPIRLTDVEEARRQMAALAQGVLCNKPPRSALAA